jgi:hypothetical protein
MNRDIQKQILSVLRWIRFLIIVVALVDALALIPWFMTGGHLPPVPWGKG